MTRNTSIENLIAIIKNALKPYECPAKVDQNRINFGALDDNGESIFTTSPLLKEMQASSTLRNRLIRIREAMKREGYILDHWE